MSEFAYYFLIFILSGAVCAENRAYPLVGNQFLYRFKRNSPTLEQPMPDSELAYRWPITYPVAPIINDLDYDAAADGIISYLSKADLQGMKEKSTDSGAGGMADKMIYQMAYPQPQYYSLPVPAGYQQPYMLRLAAAAVPPVAYPAQQYNYYDWPMRPENGNQIEPDTDAALHRSQVKNAEYVSLPYDANMESIRRQDVAMDDKYNTNMRPTYSLDRLNAAARGMAMPYNRVFADETLINNLQSWSGSENSRFASSPMISDYDIMKQFTADQNMDATINQPKQMMPGTPCVDWNRASAEKTRWDDKQTKELIARLYAKLLEDQKKAGKTVISGKSKDAGEQQIKSNSDDGVKETKMQVPAAKPEDKIGKQN